MFVVKECTKCKEYKLLDEYHRHPKGKFGYSPSCASCYKKMREYSGYNKEYWKRNMEYLRNRNIAWYSNNKEKKKAYNKKYATDNKIRRVERDNMNKVRIRESRIKYNQLNKDHILKQKRDRYNNDEIYCLKVRISSLIRCSIRNGGYKKNSRTCEILGCSYEEFKIHIESQFKKGMSWDNRSEWHLDHIIPVSLAKDEQHLIELNHYTNFQPLWAKENLSKGNKIVEKQLKLL